MSRQTRNLQDGAIAYRRDRPAKTTSKVHMSAYVLSSGMCSGLDLMRPSQHHAKSRQQSRVKHDHATSRRASCSITPQRTHNLTHKHNHTPQPQCSRLLTGSPRPLLSTKHPGTANFADQPVNGLARSETAQNPLPQHTHASQNCSRTKPQQIGGTE